MYIPKSVLLGLLVAAAGVVGWVLHGLVADADDVADATPVASVAAQAPDADGPVDPDGGAGARSSPSSCPPTAGPQRHRRPWS